MKLSNRRILITGATSGIGLATANLFAGEDASLAVLSRTRERGERVVRELVGGAKHVAVAADVGEEDAVAEAIADAVSVLGGLDGIVHCAGVDHIATLDGTSIGAWDRVMATNLRSTYLLSRGVLDHLRAAGGGTIVNLASALGLLPLPARSAYAASKAGIIMFSKSLAAEVASERIRVNALCPGAIDTPMLRGGLGLTEGDDVPDFLSDRFAMKRLGTAEEIAKAALFLTSDDSSFMTGAAITVDGGRAYH